MPLFNTTPLTHQKSKFGPSMVSYFDDTVGELTYLAWTDLNNNLFVAQIFLGDEITFGKILNLKRKCTCAPSLSVNPFIYDRRINVSWVNETTGRMGMITISVTSGPAPMNILEADIKTDSSPAVFPFFPDPADAHYRNDSCFIYKDKRNRLNWATSADGINLMSNPVYLEGIPLKSLTAPTCVDNHLIWTDYDTHQLYSGIIVHGLLNNILCINIENVKKISGMSAAKPAAIVLGNEEIVVCYRGHNYKQLFVQKLDNDYQSIIHQTQLDVESDFAPAICSFNNTPWVAWTDSNYDIQVAAMEFNKYRKEELVGLDWCELEGL